MLYKSKQDSGQPKMHSKKIMLAVTQVKELNGRSYLHYFKWLAQVPTPPPTASLKMNHTCYCVEPSSSCKETMAISKVQFLS
jgi:hypothetical protein